MHRMPQDGTSLHDSDDRPEYLGALIDDDHRLLLVPLDPERPWAAFKRMRSWMKRSRLGATRTSAELVEGSAPEARSGAEVIELRPDPRS